MSESQLLQRSRARKAPAAAKTDAPASAGAAGAQRPSWAARSTAAPFALAAPVQRKVVVGQPGDPFEREADQVADRVVGGGIAAAPMRVSSLSAGALSPLTQRMCADCEEEAAQAMPVQRLCADCANEEEVQRLAAEEEEEAPVQPWLLAQRQPVEEEEKPVQTWLGVQRQPAEEEKEAPVQPRLRVQRQAAPEEEEAAPVQAWLLAQRLPAEEEEEKPLPAPAAAVQRAAAPPPDEDEKPLAAQAKGLDEPIGGAERVSARLRSPGTGAPLPAHVRASVEPVLGADLSNVRVHTDAQARSTATSLNARAFTHQSGIWLGPGESPADVRLMAHEATHVVQQGAAARHSAPSAPAPTSSPAVQRLIPQVILEGLASYARHIPGWTLFTVIIGFNPLLGENVERTPTNLLGGIMGLVPFGTAIFDKLNEHGIIQDAFNWVRGELGRLDLSLGRIERTLQAAWDDVRLIEGFDYNLAVLRRHFGALYDDVVAFAGSLVSHVIQMIKDAVIGVAERLLAENRAWALIKKILGRDPLRDQPVEATPTEILEDFLLLIGKEQHLQQMRERGTVTEAAEWIATQIATFVGLLGELRGLFTRAWDAIQPSNLANLGTNLRTLAADAGAFLQRVWDFATTVAAKVLEFVKKALLGWLASFAHEIPGFHLVTVILGRNPFTNEAVPRTAANLIRGFITLLPGGAGIYAKLEETGTIARAAARIEGAIETLGISWEFITGLFRGIWDSLSIDDLIDPVGAFQRITDQFGEPISRLFEFVTVVLREIISIVLEMMNFPSDLIGSIIANAMSAVADIKRDPIGFILNMLAAVKKGFASFFEHIGTHLVGGLSDWLFRGLRQAGLEPPADLSLGSVLNFVLQVLGISMERIWEKLGERIGQPTVARVRGMIDRLTGIWSFVKDVQERGIGAIWEHIQSQITGLWDMVLEQARNWIMERVVNRAIQWLLSLLDITGIMPVINSFIAFFNAVQSAIEYLRDILAIINDYVTTIAAVARGEIDPGAQKMERGLANAIPVAIGFLANQFGLGNIGEKITEIVGGIRALVDRALDWLLDRAVSMGQAVLRSLGMGGQQEQAPGTPAGDATVEEGFSLSGASHRVRVVVNGGRVEFFMASNGFHSLAIQLPHLIELLEKRKNAPGANPNLPDVITYLRQTAEIFDRSGLTHWGSDPRRAPTYPAYLGMRANDVIQKLVVLQGWGIKELDDLLVRFGRNSGCMAGPYANMVDPAGTTAIGADFTSGQIADIKAANSANNGGVYKSDCPKQDPTAPIPASDVQIDHIIPKSKGGSNSYSNAQLLSSTFNNFKSDKMPSPCRCDV